MAIGTYVLVLHHCSTYPFLSAQYYIDLRGIFNKIFTYNHVSFSIRELERGSGKGYFQILNACKRVSPQSLFVSTFLASIFGCSMTALTFLGSRMSIEKGGGITIFWIRPWGGSGLRPVQFALSPGWLTYAHARSIVRMRSSRSVRCQCIILCTEQSGGYENFL